MDTVSIDCRYHPLAYLLQAATYLGCLPLVGTDRQTGQIFLAFFFESFP